MGTDSTLRLNPGASHGATEDGCRYEAFIRDGAKVNYRAEWHPGDGAPFLGPERFVKKIAKEPVPPSISRPAPAEGFAQEGSCKRGNFGGDITSEGPIGIVVNARDQFMREAVMRQGYLASDVARFLHCHPSNVSPALQKNTRLRQV